MGLDKDVFDHLMKDAPAITVARQDVLPAIKRKTAIQKVINIALHYPQAARKFADVEALAALNQPGADTLRRVFDTAARLDTANGAQLLENLRDDPYFQHVRRIAAEPPLGINDDEAATAELKESLENLRREAAKASEGARIRTHTFDAK
jgi:hypothetical protein